MPYYITDQQPGCNDWATVKENPDGTLETIGCHASKQDAIDQMIAVSIAEDMEPGGERSITDTESIPVVRNDLLAETLSARSHDECGGILFRMDEKGLETRRVTLNDFEMRDAPNGEGMTFSGYAAVFNSASEPLPFIERIAPGAFSNSLRSRNDIRMYLNHDTGRILASRRAGTLRLSEDERGLFVEADLPPTTDGRDLSILMERGDVDAMSFGFSVPSGGDWWSEDGNTRELREVRLHEVSVVTGFPAYTATTASVRSLDDLIATQGVDPSFVESAMMKLSNGEPITADEASLISSIVYELTESPDQIDPAAGIPDDMQELVNPEVEDEAPMGEVSESPAKIEIEIEVTVRELQRRQRELDLLMRRV